MKFFRLITLLLFVSTSSSVYALSGNGIIKTIVIGQAGYNGIPTGCIGGIKLVYQGNLQMYWIQDNNYAKQLLALAITAYTNGDIVNIWGADISTGSAYVRSLVPNDKP